VPLWRSLKKRPRSHPSHWSITALVGTGTAFAWEQSPSLPCPLQVEGGPTDDGGRRRLYGFLTPKHAGPVRGGSNGRSGPVRTGSRTAGGRPRVPHEVFGLDQEWSGAVRARDGEKTAAPAPGCRIAVLASRLRMSTGVRQGGPGKLATGRWANRQRGRTGRLVAGRGRWGRYGRCGGGGVQLHVQSASLPARRRAKRPRRGGRVLAKRSAGRVPPGKTRPQACRASAGGRPACRGPCWVEEGFHLSNCAVLKYRGGLTCDWVSCSLLPGNGSASRVPRLARLVQEGGTLKLHLRDF